MELQSYIEHTLLSPVMTYSQVDQLCAEAKQYGFWGVCVPSFWLKLAKRSLEGTDVRLVTVIGFPLGHQLTQSKLCEIDHALSHGADELDVVLNLSAFKSGMSWVKKEIVQCAEKIHEQEKILKVIVETAYLSEEELIDVCRLCEQAGVDFVKTSTGFAPTGARVKDVECMRHVLSEQVGIKASGGIKSVQQVLTLIKAGADRIGASAGVQIMNEYQNVIKNGVDQV